MGLASKPALHDPTPRDYLPSIRGKRRIAYAGWVVNYTFKQLQHFIAVADYGTSSGAAVTCHIAQAAMSQAIGELERIVGSQLLVLHRARGVVLTAVGTHFLRDA